MGRSGVFQEVLKSSLPLREVDEVAKEGINLLPVRGRSRGTGMFPGDQSRQY